MSTKKDIQELKDMLEDTARESGVQVSGETAELKSPEQKEAEREIVAWKTEKHKLSPVKEFRIPHELINVILTTDQYNGLVFFGEGGIGKTVLAITAIRNALKPTEWEYSNGYTTPLSLYEFLYLNRNKKVILIDDVEGLFNNRLSVSILKGALWDSDGKRIVQYSSKSEKASMPQKFVMKAKIIILCNYIPKERDATTRAMLTRTIPYKIAFTFKQKMRICKEFLQRDKTINVTNKKFIIKLLDENVSEATKDFNFRTLRKLIAFVHYDRKKAEELFQATTHNDELREAYIRASSATNVVNVQIEIFKNLTGQSRAQYFRVKREMRTQSQSLKKQDMRLDTNKEMKP